MTSVGSGQFAVYKAYLSKTESTTVASRTLNVTPGEYLYVGYSGGLSLQSDASTLLTAYSTDYSTSSSTWQHKGTIPATYLIVTRAGGYSVATSKCDFSSITDLGLSYYCMAHSSSLCTYPTNSWTWTGSNQTVSFYAEHGIYFYNGTDDTINVDCSVAYSLTVVYSINFVVCDVGTTAITS